MRRADLYRFAACVVASLVLWFAMYGTLAPVWAVLICTLVLWLMFTPDKYFEGDEN